MFTQLFIEFLGQLLPRQNFTNIHPLNVKPLYQQRSWRGKTIIILQDELGYTYSNPNISTSNGVEKKVWRCSQRNKHCNCSVVVVNEIIIERRNEHNHYPGPGPMEWILSRGGPNTMNGAGQTEIPEFTL